MTIIGTLEKALEAKKLVSIYTNTNDWDCFAIGYVDCITDKHVRLRTISKDGAEFGYEIRLLSDIFKIEMNGKYERKLEKLIRGKGNIYNRIVASNAPAKNLILGSLEQALDGRLIVALWGADSEGSLAGFVDSYDTVHVTLHLINEYGEDDGYSTIKCSEITDLDFNTQDLQIRRFLYENA